MMHHRDAVSVDGHVHHYNASRVDAPCGLQKGRVMTVMWTWGMRRDRHNEAADQHPPPCMC